MSSVRLTGQLVCETLEQVRVVEENLPLHTELSRAEPGCISFEVARTHDPLVWQVDELFQDAESFAAHQRRVADSEWGRATAGIERRYQVDGLR
ncbi:Antibiotic biosynthesis monooxygenase [Agreia bicolorata]|uniref:Antibiotic biosynthesis monooxygenase n=1 Tax=Agreia bicolorata TaxID=110935 RepID=A0A1T4YL55_9MICO|nr:antibiotic biosynthesis monooxygenase [Agreia bicolorata]SKB02554.1 Antibiotic biosynthesis monooxygenase [Agreia bicolorata]